MPDSVITFCTEHFDAEYHVLAGAPVFFLMAVIAVAVPLYYLTRLYYRHTIATLEERIVLRDEREQFQTNRANRGGQEIDNLRRRFRQLERETASLNDRVSILESLNK
jgi:hypothetical protein